MVGERECVRRLCFSAAPLFREWHLWCSHIKHDEVIAMDENDIPEEVADFIDSLTPGDVGSEIINGWTIRYEGFSGECIHDVEERMKLPKEDPRSVDCLEDVLDEVEEEFRAELGEGLVSCGLGGDEEQPIVYAVGYVEPAPEP
jgi:hypothetical protein